MYAIVDIAGQQFKVEKNNKVFVHRIDSKEGSQVSFEKVLLIDNNGKITIGEPTIVGASVVAKIVSHIKGDKILVFKKKRRKGYRVLNGHRQYLTEVIIEDILEKGQKAKPAASETEGKAETKKTAPKTEIKAVSKPAAKKAAPKTATKPAIKTTAKKVETTTKAAPKAATKKAAPKTTAKKAAPKTTAKAAPKAEKKAKPAAKKTAASENKKDK